MANYLPAMISRYSSARSFLNQWSIDHTMADSLRWLPSVTTPFLIVLGTADPTVLPDMARQMYDAATASPRRDLHFVTGGTHYFENQPELLAEALDTIAAWLA